MLHVDSQYFIGDHVKKESSDHFQQNKIAYVMSKN